MTEPPETFLGVWGKGLKTPKPKKPIRLRKRYLDPHEPEADGEIKLKLTTLDWGFAQTPGFNTKFESGLFSARIATCFFVFLADVGGGNLVWSRPGLAAEEVQLGFSRRFRRPSVRGSEALCMSSAPLLVGVGVKESHRISRRRKHGPRNVERRRSLPRSGRTATTGQKAAACARD